MAKATNEGNKDDIETNVKISNDSENFSSRASARADIGRSAESQVGSTQFMLHEAAIKDYKRSYD